MHDPGWMRALARRLESRRRDGLMRSLRALDPRLVDLGSNDYLGLRDHPRLVESVQRAAERWGIGAGASRLIGGTNELHLRVEARIAAFKGAEAALILPTGYMANLALLTALPQPGDLILMDRLNHASLIDAASGWRTSPRWHSSPSCASSDQPKETGGTGVSPVFDSPSGTGVPPVRSTSSKVSFHRHHHRDADHARNLARRHLSRNPGATIWLVSDSVFSMDGDLAPIASLAALRDDINTRTGGTDVSPVSNSPSGTGVSPVSGEAGAAAPRQIAPSCAQSDAEKSSVASRRAGISPVRPDITPLPLPPGEGRGEGPQSNPRASESGSSPSACLILDEAHATGLLGRTGAGADEAAGHRADIGVSTASKALGALGGIITGPRLVIDAVTNFARQFIFTTAVPPTQLAAIDAALDVIRDEPHRRDRVHDLARRLRAALIEKGWPRDTLGDDPTPIIPLIVGDPDAAVALSNHLERAGFFAPAIRPPSVPQGTSRVRISVHANLTDEQLDRLIEAIPQGG